MNRGYIAISSILVLAVVVLAVTVAVSLGSISGAQGTNSENQKETTLGLVDACVDEALLQINRNNSLAGTITLPEGTCSAVTNAHSGNSWTITVTYTSGEYSKSIQVVATRGATVVVNSWQEV